MTDSRGHLPRAGSQLGEIIFTLTPPYRCTRHMTSQGRIGFHLDPATSLGGREAEQTQRGTWLARDHKCWGTESRREQVLTGRPVQCFLNSLCLQGSHGLTRGSAPNAGSRWESESLASQAGRSERRQRVGLSLPHPTASGREDLQALQARQAHRAPSLLGSEGVWLGSGRLGWRLMRSSRRASLPAS